jgi:hypothetical protein
MGWRYLLFALGGLTLLLWVIRAFVFPFYESPRYLLGRGREADTVQVLNAIAAYNGSTSTLSEEALADAGRRATGNGEGAAGGKRKQVLGVDSNYRLRHLRALFSTPKMAWSTSLLIALWGGLLVPSVSLVTDRSDRNNRTGVYSLQQFLAISVSVLPSSLLPY